MRHFLSALSRTVVSAACVAGFVLIAPAVSHASPMYMYTMSLSPTSGGSYTGQLTFTSTTPIPPPGTAGTTVTTIDPTSLSIAIAGQTFTLSEDMAANIIFNGTTLHAVDFASGVQGSFEFESTSSTYVLYYGAGLTKAEYGDYGAPVLSTASPTPEPGSIALLGTGLMGVAGTLYRRRFSGQTR